MSSGRSQLRSSGHADWSRSKAQLMAAPSKARLWRWATATTSCLSRPTSSRRSERSRAKQLRSNCWSGLYRCARQKWQSVNAMCCALRCGGLGCSYCFLRPPRRAPTDGSGRFPLARAWGYRLLPALRAFDLRQTCHAKSTTHGTRVWTK